VLPSRSRMGDDTPGHKADPTKRGAAGRSKPAGLMFLALQSLQQEERQMALAHPAAMALQDGGGMGGGIGLAGGGVGGGVLDHMDVGMREAGVLEMEGMGSGGKLQQKRKRSSKTSSRLLDRKSALSMRLKFHWKAKDAAQSEARKSSKALRINALREAGPECDSRQVALDGRAGEPQRVPGTTQRRLESEAAGGSAESSRTTERRTDEAAGGPAAGPGVQQPRGLSLGDAPPRLVGQPPPPSQMPVDGRAARGQPAPGLAQALSPAVAHGDAAGRQPPPHPDQWH